MAIPDFQTLLEPFLRLHEDGKELAISEARAALAAQLGLSDEDLAEKLPSGRQGKFANRLAWAAAHLSAAGLIVSCGRGRYRLTERGRDVLAQSLPRIDLNYLKQFLEYRLFRQSRQPDGQPPSDLVPEKSGCEAELTPRERIEAAYQELHRTLARELLARIKAASPDFFERLIVDLMLRLGYGGSHEKAARVVGKSGDGGIDGIIDEDRLGLDVIYLQAKRWENDIGRPEIQKFVGALAGHSAQKGVFVTTSQFTREAREYAKQVSVKLALIDGVALANLMIDHGLGVALKQCYEIHDIDSDYFAEE